MPNITPSAQQETAAKPRGAARGKIAACLWGFCFLFFFCGFCALGIWQVERLGWKEDLIKTANANTKLPAIAAPPRADWGKIGASDSRAYNYRNVFISGVFLNDKEILVKASVLLNPLDETGGAGYWLMTPLRQADGDYVFINRGFLPLGKEAQKSRAAALPQSEVRIRGLLRLSEGAGFLFNKNDPKDHIWYNRRLPDLAAAAGLPQDKTAPYFIDADNTPNPGGWPLGGLTAVHFPNNHLVYAITWFCGALGTVIAAVMAFRGRKKA